MFKKLLSNLPFNPSLIHQVSFYAQRMKRESSIRRTGMVFLALAMFVQLFAVISPSEASVQGSTNDLLFGGFGTQAEAVQKCRDNVQGIQTILTYYQVSCDQLAGNATSTIYIKSTDYGGNLDSLGRNPQPAANPANGKPSNQYNVDIPGLQTLYMKNLWYWDTYSYSTYKVLQTTNVRGEIIMVMYDCGNIITTTPYTPPPPPAVPPPVPPTPPVLPKVISCSNLGMSVAEGSKVIPGKPVTILGQAAGQNLAAGQKVDMFYEFVDAGSSKVIGTAQSLAVPFQGNVANDIRGHSFSSNTAGQYLFRLTVKYDSSKVAAGSASGNCVKHITVQKPCEAATSSQDVEACLQLHKSAKNTTQNLTDAQTRPAQANDVIEYTLTTKNIGTVTVPKFLIKENMNDVLDYANISDLHGGQIDKDNYIFWPLTDIKPGETITHQLTIKIKDPVPSTPASSSDPAHFDCIITNTYGDSISIKMQCPVAKTVETAAALPNTGPGTSLAIGFGLTAVVGYFFARSRLFAEELDIVRQEFGNGGL